MSQASFDLLVIGSGPAGQKAALNATKLGKRVGLIEKLDMVGGVCIHTGTIPSKAIREAVLHLSGLRERSMYGNAYAVKQNITMGDLLYRAQHVVRNEVDIIRAQMHRNGVTMLSGTASFIDPHTLRIDRIDDAIEARADFILVACGTDPARPDNIPFTPNVVIDSNELLTLQNLPKNMIIVGGGVIGVEYACMLSVAGVRVTLVETRNSLLDFVDDELRELLQFRLRDMGVRLRLGDQARTR